MNLRGEHPTKLIAGVVTYIAIGCYLLSTMFGEVSQLFWAVTLVVLQTARISLEREVTTLQFSLAVSFILLFAIAAPGLAFTNDLPTASYVVSFILFADALKGFSGKSDSGGHLNEGAFRRIGPNALVITLILLLAGSLALNLLISSKMIAKLAFVTCYGLSLLCFEQLLRQRPPRSYSYLCLATFACTLILYVFFAWSGFGRIIVGSFILMPIFLGYAYGYLHVRVWHLTIFSPILIYIAQISRHGRVSDVEAFIGGSVAAPIIFTHDFLSYPLFGAFASLGKWFDQYLLLFLNWFPSFIWSEKPVGIGRLAVDEWLGGKMYSEDFSISVGFIGEQAYTLGSYYLVGLAVYLLTIVGMRKFVSKYSFGYFTPVIIFDINLISYFWGGGATYSSRAIFMLIPVIGLLALLDILSRSRIRRRSALIRYRG